MLLNVAKKQGHKDFFLESHPLNHIWPFLLSISKKTITKFVKRDSSFSTSHNLNRDATLRLHTCRWFKTLSRELCQTGMRVVEWG